MPRGGPRTSNACQCCPCRGTASRWREKRMDEAPGRWKNGSGPVPFRGQDDGHWVQLHYCDPYWHYWPTPPPIEWREKYTFTDRLRIHAFAGGRAAANMVLKSVTDGTEYTILMDDFLPLVAQIEAGGIIPGTWTFTKRGQNYFLCPAR